MIKLHIEFSKQVIFFKYPKKLSNIGAFASGVAAFTTPGKNLCSGTTKRKKTKTNNDLYIP